MVSKKKFGRVFSRSRFRVDPLILLTDKGRVVAFLEKVERGGKKLELPFYLSLSLLLYSYLSYFHDARFRAENAQSSVILCVLLARVKGIGDKITREKQDRAIGGILWMLCVGRYPFLSFISRQTEFYSMRVRILSTFRAAFRTWKRADPWICIISLNMYTQGRSRGRFGFCFFRTSFIEALDAFTSAFIKYMLFFYVLYLSLNSIEDH